MTRVIFGRAEKGGGKRESVVNIGVWDCELLGEKGKGG